MALPPDFDPDTTVDPSPDALFGLPFSADDAAVVVIPVPYEAATPRSGSTAEAPEAVLRASHRVALHDPQLPDAWREGIAMAPVDPELAALCERARDQAPGATTVRGERSHTDTIQALDDLAQQVNARVRAAAGAILDRGAIPGVLGGSQTAAFGAIQAAADRAPGFGVLHIDAHADLRESDRGSRWGAGTAMHHVVNRIPGVHHVLQVGIRDVTPAEARFIEQSSKVTTYTDHEIAWESASGEPFMRIAARALRQLPERVWVSFDIDGLDPSLCPSTADPVPGGLGWRETQLLLQLLAADHRIIGFDLTEVGAADYDATVAARLLYRLAGWAIDGRTRS